jgi:hypothetical protein
MTEIPKLVHGRLRAAVSSNGAEGSHPDANVLNAFAEQALSLTERENVLAHLALCVTCRDVLLTALPEIVVPAPVVEVETQAIPTPTAKTRQRKAFLWPSLRWVMLAAGVVTAILLARPGFEHLRSSSRNRAASSVQQPAIAELGAQAKVGQTGMPSSEAEPKSDSPPSNDVSRVPQRRELAIGASEPKPKSRAQESQKRATTASGKLAINGQKTVGEPTAVITENNASSNGNPFPTGSEPTPIVRAKPALETQGQAQQILAPDKSQTQEGGALASVVLAQSPQWVVEGGVLRRSSDSGRSWQTVLQPTNSLLCYASRGPEMWVGGRKGTLLRSTDGGASWSGITVSVGGKALSSDIKNISVQNPGMILLLTTEDEQLTSFDAGRTWEQK